MLRRISGLVGACASVGVLFLANACGEDCSVSNTCSGAGAANDGGGDTGSGDVVAPPGCDLAKAPKDSTPCIDDSVAIFVSPSGDDGAAGTKSAPVKTIAKGVTLAATRGLPRVYVCEGSYDKSVEIKGPLSMFGGLTCAWSPSDSARPKLAPPKDVALRVTNATGAVLVQDLDVTGAADTNTPGDSAIAAFASSSANVTLRNVALQAGSGTPGASGRSRKNFSDATAAGGGNANGALPGLGTSCACMDGTQSKGGDGAAGNGANVSAGSAVPAVGGANTGFSNLTTCGDGTIGANGASNAAGAAQTSPGTLTASGWAAPTMPSNAPNGNPAQGGGGGGAKTQGGTNAGGGGGCGGCGGAGGTPGGQGGSSFALLSFNSGVTVEGGSLTSGAGGKGGDGGGGQDGQPGGPVGTGACNGGPGGPGAGGSGGGGGAGGHSAPVAFVGPEPKVSAAAVTPGVKGGSGGAGAAGMGPGNAGTAGTPGPEGKAQNSLSL